MIYIFIYVGEFGYELLNWQGVIRKFTDNLKDDGKGINIDQVTRKALGQGLISEEDLKSFSEDQKIDLIFDQFLFDFGPQGPSPARGSSLPARGSSLPFWSFLAAFWMFFPTLFWAPKKGAQGLPDRSLGDPQIHQNLSLANFL